MPGAKVKVMRCESAGGAVSFAVAFQVDFMGNQSTIALTRTYLRGDNETLFNDNVYKTIRA
jgi:hypothetical protein